MTGRRDKVQIKLQNDELVSLNGRNSLHGAMPRGAMKLQAVPGSIVNILQFSKSSWQKGALAAK